MLYIRKKRGEKTMEQRKETIICLEGLGKQFQTTNGTVTALDDINLEILKGEIFGIIGLSGAGKSTLVRCINYLETPTAGRVIFEGQNLSMMKEAEIRKARQSMGMIFQRSIFWHREMYSRMCAFRWRLPVSRKQRRRNGRLSF